VCVIVFVVDKGMMIFFFLIMDMFVHLRIINNLLFFLLLHQIVAPNLRSIFLSFQFFLSNFHACVDNLFSTCFQRVLAFFL